MPAKPRRAPFFSAILRNMPAGFIPVDAVVVIKCLDNNGQVCLYTHKTPALSPWEAYGMLEYALEDYSSANVYGESE